MSNTAKCRKCRSSCPLGSYMAGQCGSASTLNMTLDFLCVECSPCGAGEYKSSSCDGRGRNDTVSCSPCTTACSKVRSDHSETSQKTVFRPFFSLGILLC